MTSTTRKNSSRTRQYSPGKVLQVFGYHLGKTIGQGTYSKVCVASNRHGQKMACKIVDKKFAGDDFIEKFLPRELNILTAIKHPNIVNVYKILEVDEAIYMFMDYCRNGDLLEYIRTNGIFSERKARNLFKQLIDAVYYLHNLDIAHRDLKCENVLLMYNNEVKLGDFGFARHCIDEFGERILSNTFCGSAAYAAPEILQGVAYDPKMYDTWALGCILYIMLTASMPFDDTNIKRMVKSQINRSIFSLIFLWPHSTHLKKLIQSLLEPVVDQRTTIKAASRSPWFEQDSQDRIKNLLSLSDSSLI